MSGLPLALPVVSVSRSYQGWSGRTSGAKRPTTILVKEFLR